MGLSLALVLIAAVAFEPVEMFTRWFGLRLTRLAVKEKVADGSAQAERVEQ